MTSQLPKSLCPAKYSEVRGNAHFTTGITEQQIYHEHTAICSSLLAKISTSVLLMDRIKLHQYVYNTKSKKSMWKYTSLKEKEKIKKAFVLTDGPRFLLTVPDHNTTRVLLSPSQMATHSFHPFFILARWYLTSAICWLLDTLPWWKDNDFPQKTISRQPL